MVAMGIVVTLLGFVLSVLSLAISSSVSGRLVIVLAGLVISLIGIIGIINKAFMKKAIWRQ
jgi:hypothetical protein